MSVLHPSSICPFLIFRPRNHVFPNASFSKRKTTLRPNDGALPTAGIFTESFEENFLLNGVSLPNSAHKSVSFLHQFLVLTLAFLSVRCVSPHWRFHKPRQISTLKTKYHLLWLPPWPQPIVEYGSSIQGRSQDGAILKISSISPKEKYFRYLPYLYNLFARGRANI
jgi:hypothetical protein